MSLLHKKGYRSLDEGNRGIVIRETDDVVYIVTVTWFRYAMKAEDYENIQRRAELLTTFKYRKSVKTLHLIITEDGMFEETVVQLIEQLSGVWLIAKDTGRIYIFEHQPKQFDDLYMYLEDELKKIHSVEKEEFGFHPQPMNLIIVALNILYFLFVIIQNGGYFSVYDTAIMQKMGALSYDGFMSGAWYELITSLFLHFGAGHLINNMILLTYVGCELEYRIGKWFYIILYFTSGIVGNIASLCYYNWIGEHIVSAGASGAIFGVIGALFILLLKEHKQTQTGIAKRLIAMAGITIYYGMTTVGVDNAAHIGGLVCGIIGGFLLSKISRYGKLK